VFHTRTLSILGDVLRIALPKDADEGPSFGDLAEVRDEQGQVVKLDEDAASLQVFTGAKGLTTSAKVRFRGHPPDVVYSNNILGRVFGSHGAPMGGGPALGTERRIAFIATVHAALRSGRQTTLAQGGRATRRRLAG